MTNFGELTGELVRNARHDDMNLKKLTKQQEVLLLMSDGEWHSGRQLSIRTTHRFGSALFCLKKKGVRWEKQLDPYAPKGERWWDYRLVT